MPIEMVRSIRNSHQFEWMLENFWKKDARKESGERLERDWKVLEKGWTITNNSLITLTLFA